MKRPIAEAVTCARCAAVVALDAEHCGICWWPVNATISADPSEQSEAVEPVVVPEEVVEPADDYITEQIPVVLVAAADVNGPATRGWAPLPGTPLPGPNPFGTIAG